MMATVAAAVELLFFAKFRLDQVYNPKLHNPPAARELSVNDRSDESALPGASSCACEKKRMGGVEPAPCGQG